MCYGQDHEGGGGLASFPHCHSLALLCNGVCGTDSALVWLYVAGTYHFLPLGDPVHLSCGGGCQAGPSDHLFSSPGGLWGLGSAVPSGGVQGPPSWGHLGGRANLAHGAVETPRGAGIDRRVEGETVPSV